MIESILEHQSFGYAASTSAITVAAAATAATSTNYGNLALGDLIAYLDDAGVQRYGQIATLPGAPNLTLETPAIAAATGTAVRIASDPTAYFFEGNNAQLKSDIVTIGPANAILAADATKDLFSKDEGFAVKSVYLRLPYQYTLADGAYTVQLKYYTAAGVFIANVLTIGESGDLLIPVENTEIAVNAFVPPAPGGVDYKIHGILSQGVANIGASEQRDSGLFSISNVDAPDVLNGEILQVRLGVRIVHASVALT